MLNKNDVLGEGSGVMSATLIVSHLQPSRPELIIIYTAALTSGELTMREARLCAS